MNRLALLEGTLRDVYTRRTPRSEAGEHARYSCRCEKGSENWMTRMRRGYIQREMGVNLGAQVYIWETGSDDEDSLWGLS